jgi:hypothetical protein
MAANVRKCRRMSGNVGVCRADQIQDDVNGMGKRDAREVVVKDPPSSSRPLRMQVIMDSNWWMWNLLLAASPAVIIALYCEFVAKPQMIEQLQQQAQQGDDQI